MKPIIISEKHYVQFPQATTTANALTQKLIINTVSVVNKDFQNEVEEGSVIKAVWIELWVISAALNQSFGTVTVEKIPVAAPTMTFTNANNLNVYSNKKNILWTFEGLYPEDAQNPIPVIRQWIKIPKSKQRFGLSDRLALNITSGADSIISCGFMTYKEYK